MGAASTDSSDIQNSGENTNSNNDTTNNNDMMDTDNALAPLVSAVAQGIEPDNVDVNANVDIDDTPEFVSPEDVVEVHLDNDNAPMDEDEDEDDNDDENFKVQPEAEMATDDLPVEDMAIVTLTTHQGPVYAVCAFMDPQTTTHQWTIVSGGGDDRAFLHKGTTMTTTTTTTEATTTTVSQPLEYQHTDSVSAVVLNLPYLLPSPPLAASDNNEKSAVTKKKPDPPLIAVGAYDGAICLYNADNGALWHTLEGPTDVECLAFHKKGGGTVLLAGSAADGTLWMYHLPTKKCLQVFVGHESSVTCCDFTFDGKWAVSASSDGTIRVWAPRTGICRHVFACSNANNNNNNSDGTSAGLTCLAVGGGADQQLIMAGSENGFAYVCHVGTKKMVATLQHHAEDPAKHHQHDHDEDDDDDEQEDQAWSVEAVGFSPSQPHWCATGGVDGVLKIWDLNVGSNGTCRQVCRFNDDNSNKAASGITRLTWHPTLPLVFTATTTARVHVWDARNGLLLHTVTGHTDVLNDMTIQFTTSTTTTTSTSDNATNMAWIVTASDDHSVRLFPLNVTQLWNAANQNSMTTG